MTSRAERRRQARRKQQGVGAPVPNAAVRRLAALSEVHEVLGEGQALAAEHARLMDELREIASAGPTLDEIRARQAAVQASLDALAVRQAAYLERSAAVNMKATDAAPGKGKN